MAAHHLLLAHGLAVLRLRSHVRADAQVGITLNLTPIFAADDRAETMQGVERADALHNRWFLDPLFRAHYPERLFRDLTVDPPPVASEDMALISTPLDFLGVNYYSRALIRGPQPTREHYSAAESSSMLITSPSDGLLRKADAGMQHLSQHNDNGRRAFHESGRMQSLWAAGKSGG
jgi:beta-glucosidase